MSRRVSFSPEQPINKVGGNKKRMVHKIWIFKIPRGSKSSFSLGSFFKQIGAKVAKSLPLISSSRRRCSRKVSSSASLVRSRSYAETTLDSQRAEAIEDCIEFLNSSSSSSLQRSNSVSSSC